jgi:hypothetical protein
MNFGFNVDMSIAHDTREGLMIWHMIVCFSLFPIFANAAIHVLGSARLMLEEGGGQIVGGRWI